MDKKGPVAYFGAQFDRQIAAGFLEIQLAELDSVHFQTGNPAFYTAEAVFAKLWEPILSSVKVGAATK